jgi:mRNA interferase MazF
MRRGDIYLVDFEPAQGAEAGKARPAVVVSNEGVNLEVPERGWGVINVVPLTSRLSDPRPYQVFIPAQESGLDRDSTAQAEQIRAVSIGRFGDQLGRLPPELMNAVDDALRVQLVL